MHKSYLAIGGDEQCYRRRPLALAVLGTVSCAQTMKLPPTSRTVFKCEIDKKISYSDEPCLGAKRIDVEPTRGMDQLSGRKSVGSDVRREQTREEFANAVKPLTGMDTKQFQTQGRRMKLSTNAQTECKELDGTLANAET
jgi:hypothetical protein